MLELGSDNFPVAKSPAVVLDRASKTYRVTEAGSRDASAVRSPKKGRMVTSLHETTLVARKGEAIGVLGRNGSGKSTLLKLIAGSEVPTTGSVSVSAKPMLLGVAPALQPYLTGRQNVVLGCMALGMSRRQANEIEPSISEWADIGDAIDRPLSTYSAGQGARLSFAISTAVEPEILLVDEALSTGDAGFSAKARERMASLLNGAGNLFLVSHTMEQIVENCSRAIWIHNGEVIADGDAGTIVDSYNTWIKQSRAHSGDGLLAEIKASYRKPDILWKP